LTAKAWDFLSLADGWGDFHVSFAHLESGATVKAPSITHAAAPLVVHGRMTVTTKVHGTIRFRAGMGAVVAIDELYSLEPDTGAIVVIVESDELILSLSAISTPGVSLGKHGPGM
jgi:hypothetical protein